MCNFKRSGREFNLIVGRKEREEEESPKKVGKEKSFASCKRKGNFRR